MTVPADLAFALWRARIHGGAVPRAAADGLDSVEAAYGVQRDIASLAARPRVGWKVGATSIAAQRLLGTDGPATAPMFADHCVESPAEIAVFANQDASIESEFGFRFARDLPPRRNPYRRDEVLNAVATVFPATEIVGCRFEGGFADMGAIRLVADMVANADWVKGRERADWRELNLKTHPVRLHKDGALVAEGVGANVLGDPLAVLEWTANHLSALGEGIREGEVVSTGTCTGVTPVAPGQTFVADFAALGRIEVRFVQKA